MEKDIASLQHTTWRCQYHVVFAHISQDGDIWEKIYVGVSRGLKNSPLDCFLRTAVRRPVRPLNTGDKK